MDYERLTLPVWDALTSAEREQTARTIAESLPTLFEFKSMESHSQGEQTHEIAFFDWGGIAFALIPGGRVTLGYDWNRTFSRTLTGRVKAAMLTSLIGLRFSRDNSLTPIRETVLLPVLMQVRAEEFGVKEVTLEDPEVKQEFERIVLTPNRTVTSFRNNHRILRFSMDVDSNVEIEEKKPVTNRDIQAELASQGFRLPMSDEWEHACAAGARTLFRWGDTCPIHCYPNDSRFEEWARIAPLYQKQNAFGLWIATDPYNWEVCVEPEIVRGGDGGVAICGAEGIVAGWLPLASSFTRRIETDYDFSTVYVRRVFPLSWQ